MGKKPGVQRPDPSALPSEEDVLPPEEPPFVERADGLRHLPRTRARAFLNLVRAGTSLSRDLDAELESLHGISLHEFEVLLHLAVFSPDGSLRLGRLVEQAPLSQSRVSRLVSGLDARGLVTRSSTPEDARAVDVTITPAGLDLFRRAQDTHLKGLNERLYSRLTWEETVALAAITGKLLGEEGP